jgi:hypothetical protein
MSRIPSKRPSPAMVVAIVALLTSLAGAAWAGSQISGSQLANRSVDDQKLRANDVDQGEIQAGGVKKSELAKNSAGGSEVIESDLGTVPRAESAHSADLAANSSALGGVPASAFHHGCEQGTVHGLARVRGVPSFSKDYLGVPFQFNCTGKPVEAKRVAEGVYRVRFEANGSFYGVGSVDSASPGDDDDFLSITTVGDGGTAFEVTIRDANGGAEDATFTLAIF